MIGNQPRIRNGGGTGSEETSVVTTTSDPFDSSGKTGSEIIAEGGAPEATVTSDPHTTDMGEKYDGDPKQAFDDMVSLAHDGDDGETATFDSVPNDEQGQQAMQDSVETIVNATTGGNDNSNDVPSQAETAAANAANALPGATGSDGGGILSAILGVFSAVVSAVTSALGGT
jgi:hypothetical protein